MPTARPLVTALCLTRNRRSWLPHAIACFLRQDYEPREMLILADGEDVADLIPNDARVRHVRMVDGYYTIGGKRNAGTLLARGDIIATWDDDDHSEPERLTDQADVLMHSPAQVTGYQSMRFTDGDRWFLYTGVAALCVGTSLCYRREWALAHPFEDKQIHEDLAFTLVAGQAQVFAVSTRLDLMHASIHSGNTSPRPVDETSNWSRCEPPHYSWRRHAVEAAAC
jgi:glycosyltransferase involved in cell wall biosynthesis